MQNRQFIEQDNNQAEYLKKNIRKQYLKKKKIWTPKNGITIRKKGLVAIDNGLLWQCFADKLQKPSLNSVCMNRGT